ncbi:hypothetical protein [Klebsiella sp. 2680]|uniref:hypothetical protein n=1 Tax=Klebsiella sp. 2680 TaxID=2018037 RepID=UPI001158A92B
MTSKLTREELINIIETDHVQCGEASELARMALAAMNSKPVFFIEVEGDDWINAGRIPGSTFDFNDLPDGINNLYATPQPAPELTATVERLNASGYEYEGGEVTPQNAAAVVDILLQQLDDAVQGRNAQPVPVARNEREAFEAFMAKRFGDLVDQRRAKNGDRGYMAWDMVVAWIVWQARAATLQAEPVATANKLGNYPVIPDGYVMVPREPTEDMIAAAMNCDDVLFNSDESFCVQFGNIYEAMLAASPKEIKS